MYTTLITLFAFFLAIFILVAFHEYGHFKMARLCNIKVLKFSIGFGPSLFHRKDKHGTEFILAPIPLGGYVKMLDEREGDVPSNQYQYEFNNKKPWQKIAVVAAGPIFNFILAFILFYFMFVYGIQVERPVIQFIEPGSIAEKVGLEANQEIISIDNNKITSFADLQIALASRLGTSGMINIQAKKFNLNAKHQAIQTNSYNLPIDNFQADVNKEPIGRQLGLWFLPKYTAPMLVSEILPDSNAKLNGLIVGDTIVKYDNKNIENWDEVLEHIKNNPGKNVKLTIVRDSKELNIVTTIGSKYIQEDSQQKKVGQLGIMFRFPMYFEMHSYGIIESISKALGMTVKYISQTFYMLYKLIVGEMGVETVRGPVMVAKAAGMQIQMGLSNFLNFLAIISIGLGVINLLPIPVLDGGHLVYHLYELITGRRVSELTERISLIIGITLLAMMMGMAFYNDFVYW